VIGRALDDLVMDPSAGVGVLKLEVGHG
jgi:hypothetical protein